MDTNRRTFTLLVVTALVCLLAVAAWPRWAQAGRGLPPRERPSPSQPENGDKDDTPPGAYIQLTIRPIPPAAWTVVQWQDSAGGWHNVEGWQGPPNAAGQRRWWVSAKDFGTGPFRWVVKQGPNTALLGTSPNFNLPGSANELLEVMVLLEP